MSTVFLTFYLRVMLTYSSKVLMSECSLIDNLDDFMLLKGEPWFTDPFDLIWLAIFYKPSRYFSK